MILHLGRHSADPGSGRQAIDALAELRSHACERAGAAGSRASSTSAAAFLRRAIPSGARCPSARTHRPDPRGGRYAEAACEHLAERLHGLGIAPDEIQLEIEPGALYADAGIHPQRSAT